MRSLSRSFFASRTAFGIAGVAALTALVCVAAAPSAMAQDIITQWNFNDGDGTPFTGTLSPGTGVGSAVAVGTTSAYTSGDATLSSDPSGVSDDSAWRLAAFPNQSTANETEGAQFNVDITGYENIQVSFDVAIFPNASRYWRLQYTSDGTTFTNFVATTENTANIDGSRLTSSGLFDFGSNIDGEFPPTLNQVTADLSSITFAGTPDLFGFRLVSAFAPGTTPGAYASGYAPFAYNTGGGLILDMVTVSEAVVPATVVPEPGTLALAGMGALVLAGVVARRRKVGTAATA